ncbi:MAG: hypothetical protein IJK89_06070 [Clostridia bacterium]|nr:hypothetical protein [Clostridia bacterium]
MKQLYLIAKNHMDPSWLRCFTDHFREPQTGKVVRPYSDLEEFQILEYMDFAEQYGVKYEIEQSCVVKKFLERNPDQKERFAALVKRGLLELAGGGEAVIDYNLTGGESWARNHLYSRKYYDKEFGHKPRYAITPDIFGLPAQLPQFFRSLGYDADILFDRVFLQGKPYWRGLDGTLIVLDDRWLNAPPPVLRTADCVKLPCCPVCKGEGCECCEGIGVDRSYSMTRPDKEILQGAYYGNRSADDLIDELLQYDKNEYYVLITTEEPPVGDHLFGQLKEAGAKRGVNVNYVSFEENHDLWCKGYVDKLRRGDVTEDEIDPRPEGNPASTGDCSSRIEIKKANRELEQLLYEAENLAVLARLSGGWDTNAVPRRDYPAQKLELLWNKMAFIQFHDCVTGTHCDASYAELERYIREVRRGAEEIYHNAALELLRGKGIDVPEGYRAAVFFNPTEQTVRYPRLLLRGPVGASTESGERSSESGDGLRRGAPGTKTVKVYDSACHPLAAFDAESVDAMADAYIRVTVKADVPPFSCRVFLWQPETAKETAAPLPETAIENEYYRVTAANGRIAEIYDKTADRPLVANGGLTLTVDNGSPWGRDCPEGESTLLYADETAAERGAGVARLTLRGRFRDTERDIEKLDWRMTVALYNGEPLVRFDTKLDWQGERTRLYASFTPAFAHDGDILCEVSFGTIRRGSAEDVCCLGWCDDWPSLGFAGVTGEGMNLALLKGGFPGTSVKNGALRVALLRAMRDGSSFAQNYAGTGDHGVHTAAFALASSQGDFADGDFSNRAAAFNFRGHTECVGPRGGEPLDTSVRLPWLADLPDGLRLGALKWAEDGSGPVVRFWESAGRSVTLTLPRGVTLLRCDTLENPETDTPTAEYTFRPFEIATFRVITSR